MTTVRELIQALENNHELDDVIAFELWSVDDVMERAAEREIEVTREEAEWVLESMERHHDCIYGMNWQALDNAIDSVVF